MAPGTRRRQGRRGMLRGPLDTPLYRVAARLRAAGVHTLYRMRVDGARAPAAAGPVVLASNHLSNIDPVFLGVACPRQIHFMAKAELWKVPLVGRLVDAAGLLPGAAGRGRPRGGAARRCDVLSAGAVLGIFPEGHRSAGGPPGRTAAGCGPLLAARGSDHGPRGARSVAIASCRASAPVCRVHRRLRTAGGYRTSPRAPRPSDTGRSPGRLMIGPGRVWPARSCRQRGGP